MPAGEARRSTRAWLVVLVLAALLAAATAPRAHAVTRTQTFHPTDAEQTFFVPPGITTMRATLIGGRGGNLGAGTGGGGIRLVVDIPVTGGTPLYIEVGGNGQNGSDASGGSFGLGGFNGGGNGGGGAAGPSQFGGGGGGASDIRTTPRAQNNLNSRIVTTPGGGGATKSDGGSAAFGGDGTGPGQPGIDCPGSGGGGSQSAAGSGGVACNGGDPGVTGVLGQGGNGGGNAAGDRPGGGGGGGGAFGGGGGGQDGGQDGTAGGSGAGGGGAVGFQSGVTVVSGDNPGLEPSITLEWESPTADVTPPVTTFFGTQPIFSVSAPKTLTVANNGTAPLVVTGVDFVGLGPGPENDFFVSSNTCGGYIQVGDDCEVGVKFNPQGVGPRTAFVQFHTNAGSSPVQRQVTGTGGNLPAGPTGPTGADGATGPTGPAGPTGPTGVRGPTGPAGPTGADGTDGQDGQNGTNGQQGQQGPQGPAGAQGPKGDPADPAAIAVSCVNKTVTKTVKGKKVKRKVIVCTVKDVKKSGTATAKLSRAGKVYASGTGTASKGKARVVMRRAPKGRYKLTLKVGRSVVKLKVSLG